MWMLSTRAVMSMNNSSMPPGIALQNKSAVIGLTFNVRRNRISGSRASNAGRDLGIYVVDSAANGKETLHDPPSTKDESAMKIARIDTALQEPWVNPLFPSGGVARQKLVGVDDSPHLSFTLLNFSAGAPNAFHFHTHDQVIVVASGKGIVRTEKQSEQHEVDVGHYILFSAGERHWHSACPACAVTFISVTPTGTTTTVI